MSNTNSTEAIFTKIIITLQHFVRKSYMEFNENTINRLVVDPVIFSFLKTPKICFILQCQVVCHHYKLEIPEI